MHKNRTHRQQYPSKLCSTSVLGRCLPHLHPKPSLDTSKAVQNQTTASSGSLAALQLDLTRPTAKNGYVRVLPVVTTSIACSWFHFSKAAMCANDFHVYKHVSRRRKDDAPIATKVHTVSHVQYSTHVVVSCYCTITSCNSGSRSCLRSVPFYGGEQNVDSQRRLSEQCTSTTYCQSWIDSVREMWRQNKTNPCNNGQLYSRKLRGACPPVLLPFTFALYRKYVSSVFPSPTTQVVRIGLYSSTPSSV